MPLPRPHLPRFDKFLFGNSLQHIWLHAKICPMMPLWVGVKFFSVFFWVLDVLHAHHHRKEDLGRRGAVAQAEVRRGQRFHGRSRVAGGPGNPENGLISTGGFQAERCFWPSVPEPSGPGQGAAPVGPFIPRLHQGLWRRLEKPVVSWVARGWARSPCLPILSGSRAAHGAHHTGLFAAPLWVARASHCPSTIVVALLV